MKAVEDSRKLQGTLSLKRFHLCTKVFPSQTVVTLDASLSHFRLVVANHLLQAHAHGPSRLPVENLLGPGGVGSALLRVVSRHGLVDDVDTAGLEAVLPLDFLDDLTDEFSELANGELVAVAQIDGASLVRVHEDDEAIDEVMDVLEGAGLLAVTVHGHVFAAKRLDDEVRDHTSVERVH